MSPRDLIRQALRDARLSPEAGAGAALTTGGFAVALLAGGAVLCEVARLTGSRAPAFLLLSLAVLAATVCTLIFTAARSLAKDRGARGEEDGPTGA